MSLPGGTMTVSALCPEHDPGRRHEQEDARRWPLRAHTLRPKADSSSAPAIPAARPSMMIENSPRSTSARPARRRPVAAKPDCWAANHPWPSCDDAEDQCDHQDPWDLPRVGGQPEEDKEDCGEKVSQWSCLGLPLMDRERSLVTYPRVFGPY